MELPEKISSGRKVMFGYKSWVDFISVIRFSENKQKAEKFYVASHTMFFGDSR